jgi:NADH dehydrogenase
MLGLPLARRLKSDGFEVAILTTGPERARARFGDEFQWVVGDVTAPDSLPAALKGADIVYLNLNAKHDPILYQAIEIEGTASVARAAAEAGVSRIAMISGASSEGREEGIIYLDAKVKAEKSLIESGVAYTIFRPSWFFESLPLFVQGNRAAVLGRQPIKRGWLAARDYARQVSAAFQTEAAANKCFYNLGPVKMTILEAVQQFCARVHPEINPTSVPFAAARALSLLPGQSQLRKVLPFFKYFETRPENGSPTEADRILGPNLTTLEEWLDSHVDDKPAGG